jgi:hypothetical protein
MVRSMLKILIAASLGFTSLATAQEVGLSARTDSAQYRIGDWINLLIEGNVRAEIDSIGPAVRDSIGPFEVLEIKREVSKPAWTIRLMTVDSGKIFIPAVPFVYRLKGDTAIHRAFTNSVFLTINAIPIDPKGDIKDIKPPISAPWQLEDFIPYAILILILAAAAFGYYYYRKKQKEKEGAYVPPKPKIAPHTAALYALRELEDKKLWQGGKVKQFYSEATEIIRTFFERRWNIIALELTSDEILAQMKNIPESEAVWKQMQSFFVTADLVKFAKYVPSPKENETELGWAYEIVRAMTPTPATVEEERQEEVANVR